MWHGWALDTCSSYPAVLGRLLVADVLCYARVHLCSCHSLVFCVPLIISVFWCSAYLCCAAMGVCGWLSALCVTFAVLLTLYIVDVFEFSCHFLLYSLQWEKLSFLNHLASSLYMYMYLVIHVVLYGAYFCMSWGFMNLVDLVAICESWNLQVKSTMDVTVEWGSQI